MRMSTPFCSASCPGVRVRADPEADDHRLGGLGQEDVGLVDGTHGAVHDLDADLVGGELLQRVGDGLDRAVHVGLDDEGEALTSPAP
jgi:hypothetical protein